MTSGLSTVYVTIVPTPGVKLSYVAGELGQVVPGGRSGLVGAAPPGRPAFISIVPSTRRDQP